MADRSMLFAVAERPSESQRHPRNIGLCEIGYYIPAIFKLLVSVNSAPALSLIWDVDGEPLAVAGNAKEGLDRLRAFRSSLPRTAKALPAIDAAIEHLSKPHFDEFPFFLLEPCEIFGLSEEPLGSQLDALIAEIKSLSDQDLTRLAEQNEEPDWPERECWTDILYFETEGRVRPPVDVKETLLFTTPAHILENEALFPHAEATDVSIEFEANDPQLGPAIAALANLPHLAVLILHGSCAALPDSISLLTNLKSLVAGNIGLTGLSDGFGRLQKLEAAYLQQNQFREFPPVLRKLKRLKTLSLWGMPLKQIPSWIDEINRLEDLLLNKCELTGVPDTLFGLPALRRLDISDNPDLAALPEDVAGAISLKILAVGECNLTALPESLGRLTNLEDLYVGNNRLASIPRSICDMPLKTLGIAGNPIRRGLRTRLKYKAKKVYQ